MISSNISGLLVIESKELNFFYYHYMESSSWKPTEEEREVMEAVWMQVKGACEKLKEETNAKDEHIRKMLKEMADRYYS